MKIKQEFIDTGFGFEIKLLNVPMVEIRGEWTPKINYNELARVVLHRLSHKTSRLTGNETKFIRTYFEMTLQKFAKRFCVTHAAVIKWEQAEDSPTNMNWATEKDIRLFILNSLDVNPEEFASLYTSLENVQGIRNFPMNLDAKKLRA